MKTAYPFAAKAAALFILDDSLRASLVFVAAFFFGTIITTLFRAGEKAADEQSDNDLRREWRRREQTNNDLNLK